MYDESWIRLPFRRAAVAVLSVIVGGFLAVGAVGLVRYGIGYWRYRGFDPPRDPAYVTAPGTQVRLEIPSAALGGRREEVYVYLPPATRRAGSATPSSTCCTACPAGRSPSSRPSAWASSRTSSSR
jgi:hypothetical protein